MPRRRSRIDPECQAGLEFEIDSLARAVVAADVLPPRRWLARWGALPTENLPKEFRPLVEDYKFIRNQLSSQFKRSKAKAQAQADDVRYQLIA